jgi:hypothetical protein
MVAVELPLTAAVDTVKLADVAPAGIVTDGPTVNVALEFERVTLAPPAGAVPLSFTVQVELLELLKLAGEHDMELTLGKAGLVTTPPAEERPA